MIKMDTKENSLSSSIQFINQHNMIFPQKEILDNQGDHSVSSQSLSEEDIQVLSFFFNSNEKIQYTYKDFLIINDEGITFEKIQRFLMEDIDSSLLLKLLPYMLDLYKRKINLKIIKDLLVKISFLEHSKVKLFRLSLRNILEILLQTLDNTTKAVLGMTILDMSTFIPLNYWKINLQSKTASLEFDFPLLYSIKMRNKVNFLNFGFDENIGKTEFLSRIFPLDLHNLNINKNGILRKNTLDLYSIQDCFIFDVHKIDFSDKYFAKAFSRILDIADVIIFHFSSKSFKSIDASLMESNIKISLKQIAMIERDANEPNKNEQCYKTISAENSVHNFSLDNIKEMDEEMVKCFTEAIRKWISNFSSNNYKKMKPFNLEYEISHKNSSLLEDSNQLDSILDKIYRNVNENFSLMKAFVPFSELKFQKSKKLQLGNYDEVIIIQKEMEKFNLRDQFSYSFGIFLIKKQEIATKILDNKLRFISENYVEEKINERKRLFDLISRESKSKLIENDLIKQHIHKISLLNEEINNNNINFYSLMNELFYIYDHYKSLDYKKEKLEEDDIFWEELKKKYSEMMFLGYNTQLLKITPSEIEHKFLKEIFEMPSFLNKKFFVISVLGIQSSAKSTLLNYLFGSNFDTNDGKCTHGIYFSIIRTKNPDFNIILLDTEGLSSLEGQDKLFDNQMALMCFGISNLVLINQKGELSKYLNDLLEISVFAMSYMTTLKEVKSKVFFILRDQVERTSKKQEIAFNTLKLNLQEICKKYEIDLENILDIDIKNFILLPSAFQEKFVLDYETKHSSEIFSNEILNLRRKIFEEIEAHFKSKNFQNHSMNYFYQKACTLWKSLNEYGIDILNCKSLREYEKKNEINIFLKQETDICLKKIKENIDEILSPEFEMIKEAKKKMNFEYEKIINEIYKIQIQSLIENTNKKFKAFEKSLIEPLLEDKLDFLETEKKTIIYEWGEKLKIFENSLANQIFNDEISLKMENEIAKYLEKLHISKSEDPTIIQEVEKTIFRMAEKYKQEIISKNDNSIQKNDLLKHSLDIFKNSIKQMYLKLSLANLIKAENLDTYCIAKYWIRIFWYEHLNSEHIKKKKTIHVLNLFTDIQLTLIDPYEEEYLNPETCFMFINKIEKFFLNSENKQRIDETMLTTDFSLLFIKHITEVIMKNQKLKRNEEIQKSLRIIDQSAEKNLELFRSRKNDLNLTNQIANIYLLNLRDYIVNTLMHLEVFKLFEQELRDVPKDPEIYINHAYQISFENKNLENVLKYVLDVNKFCEEIFDDYLNPKINRMKNILKQIFIDHFRNSLKQLENIVIIFFENNEDSEFLLKNLNEVIFQNFKKEIQPNVIFNQKLFNSKDFQKNFILFVQTYNIEEDKIISEIETDILNLIKKRKSQIIGCEQRCPFCRSKCKKSAGDHKNHEAKHLLISFGGCHYKQTNQVLLDYCLDKKCVASRWSSSKIPEKVYPSLTELCEIEYPHWTHDIKENKKKVLLSEKERTNLIELWYLVRKPLLKHYDLKDETDHAILKYQNFVKSLEENYHLDDYGI